MLLKIQTKPKPTIIVVDKDAYCSVYQTNTFEVVLIGQIFNDLHGYQNPAHYFYETVIRQPEQKVDDIDGYFGVILLDKTTASVEVFRDPIGMQPLYYALQNEEYLFSTTLKDIKEALPDATPCEEFFLKYLEEIVPNTYDLTMYEGILRITPNSHYLFKEGKQRGKRQLFDFKNIAIQNRTDDEAIRLLQERLENAVEKYSAGQKDLFFQYTGGLDSTGIVAVSRFLRGNTEGFHTYIHKYMPDDPNFDERHIVKKLHQTEDLPLPYYTPKNHFETLEAEVAHGKAYHTLKVINQVLDNIYLDINSKIGIDSSEHSTNPKSILFSGFGGDECITFNQSPIFLTNQLKDFRWGKMLKSMQVYGIKRCASHLIRRELPSFLYKAFFPDKIITDSFNFRNSVRIFDNFRHAYDTHDYIRCMLALPHVAYRIEEEKEMAAHYGVVLAYPWLDFPLLRYFLSLKENQLIYKKRGRLLYKNALRKYIQSEWYFNYSKRDSVYFGEPTILPDEKELNAQLTCQYEKLPLFIKQYNFRDKLLKKHTLEKESLVRKLSIITLWLSNT